MPNETGENENARKLYNGLSAKNPQLKEVGFDRFYKDIQHDKNLKKLFHGLAIKNPQIQQAGYDGFKQSLFPEGVKKKEQTVGSANASNGSETTAPKIPDNDSVQINHTLDLFRQNVSLQDYAPEIKQGLLSAHDKELKPEDQKLIADYRSLYSIDPREQNLSRDEIIQDLRLHHEDYDPPENQPQYRLPTEEEWAEFGKEKPDEIAKIQKESGKQLKGVVNLHTESQVDGVYTQKAKDEALNDAQLLLMSDKKANQWIGEAWSEQNEDIRATDRWHKFKMDALNRQVEKHTGFEKDIEKAAEQFGGKEALLQNPELKDQVKTQVLNERLNYGIQFLSPDQKQLYELQTKQQSLQLKLAEQLSPNERLELGNQMQLLEGEIKGLRDQFPKLYDPLTGEYIDSKDATKEETERAELYEKKVQKEMAKYQNTDLGSMLRTWNKLQSKYKYIQQELVNEPVAQVPGEGTKSIRWVFDANKQFQDMNMGFGPALTGDAADKMHKYWDMEKEYKAKFDAVNRALLLNQDPSTVDKGFFSLFAEHAVEGFGFKVDSDADFIENLVNGLEETGGVVTLAQKKASIDKLKHTLGKGMGDSIRPMVELIVTSTATAGLGNIPAIGRAGSMLKGAMTSRWGKAGNLGYNMLKGQLQGTISFGLASDENLSAIMGFGEGTVQGIMDSVNPANWIKKSKYAKLFEVGVRSFAGMTGETASEFVGDYLNHLSESGYNWELAFEQTFGRTPEEFEDKLLTTAIMSGMFSGTHNSANMTFNWAKEKLAESSRAKYLTELEKLQVEQAEENETEIKENQLEGDTETINNLDEAEITEVTKNATESKVANTEKDSEFYTKNEKALVRSSKDGLEVINTASGETVDSKRSSIYRQAIDEYKEHVADQLDTGERIEFMEGMQEEEVVESIAESSQNPVEVAEAYLMEADKSVDEDTTIEMAIAEELKGTRITAEAFAQDGDSNHINKAMRLHYFSKKGKGSLDQVVEGIKSENPHLEHLDEKELTQNIIDFIVDHPGGAKSYKPKNEMAKSLEGRFEALTGFSLNEEYAKRISQPTTEVKETHSTPVENDFGYVEEEVPFGPEKKYSKHPEGEQNGPDRKAKNTLNLNPRIEPSPLKGKKPKPLRNMILDFSKGLAQNVSYVKPLSRKASGSYNTGTKGLKIRFQGDLDSTAHEMGHSLDDLFGILSKIPEDRKLGIEKELSTFWPHGSRPPASKKGKDAMEYRKREGVAEWIRAHMVNPEEAAKVAPFFTEWFKSQVPKKTQDIITTFSNDIRIFSGATPHEQMASNIDFKPGDSKRKDPLLKKKPQKGEAFHLSYTNKLAKKWTNVLNPMEAGFSYAMGEKGVKEVKPKDDVRILARLHLGINEKFNDILENGLIDNKNKRLVDEKTGKVKTFKWLLEPLDNVDEDQLAGELKEVITSMVAERSVELVSKFSRKQIEKDLESGKLPPADVLDLHPDLMEKHAGLIDLLDTLEVKEQPEERYDFTNKVLTGVGGGMFSDLDTAVARIGQMDELQRTDPKKYARIKEATRRYRTYADDILRYMVDKGRFSEKQYKLIKENNVQYVALQRVMESEPGVEIEVFSSGSHGGIGTITEPIKPIEGSSRPILNPYLPLMDTAFKSIKEADRNEIMLAFREMLSSKRQFSEGDPMYLASVGQQVKSSENDAIPIFIDGKAEYWKFQKDIHKTLKGITDYNRSLPAYLTALPSALRWTVTHFPVFGLRNWIRDTQSRLVISDTGSGFKDFFGDKTDEQDFKLFGGGQFGYYFKDQSSYYHKLEEAINDLAQNKKFILLDPKRFKNNVWDKGYMRMLEAAETSNRVAEYRSAYKEAKKQGMDDYNAGLYAASKARDLLDFAIAGEYMQIINQLVPFSNAAVQGLKKTILAGYKDPGGFLLRWVLYAMLPAIANRVIVGMMGDEAEEEFQNFPDYQRDLFYNFPIAPDLWLSIPKPFELGVFASGAERLLDRTWYNNEEAFDGYLGSVARSTLPVDESAFAGPMKSLVETMTNYDFFRQRHIIPIHEEGLDLDLRNTDKASRIGKAIQAVSGLDGRFADQWIKSNFSYYGKLSLKLSDLGREDSFNQFDLSDLGIFKRSRPFSNKDVEWVLSTARSKGLRNHKDYRELQNLIGDYVDESDSENKSKKADVLTDYAKELKKSWGNKYNNENKGTSTINR